MVGIPEMVLRRPYRNIVVTAVMRCSREPKWALSGWIQLLILTVALFLVGFAVLSLVNVIAITWGPIFVEHDYTKAIANGFDAAFMTVILLEVLHTVLSRAALSTLVIEFLVIAITSAVRHSLEIAAASGSEHEVTQTVCGTVRSASGQLQHACRATTQLVANTSGQEIVLELMLNAGCVLLLVLALWLMHTIRPNAGYLAQQRSSLPPRSTLRARVRLLTLVNCTLWCSAFGHRKRHYTRLEYPWY